MSTNYTVSLTEGGVLHITHQNTLLHVLGSGSQEALKTYFQAQATADLRKTLVEAAASMLGQYQHDTLPSWLSDEGVEGVCKLIAALTDPASRTPLSDVRDEIVEVLKTRGQENKIQEAVQAIQKNSLAYSYAEAVETAVRAGIEIGKGAGE